MDKICSCHVVSACNRGMLTVFCMWISMVYPPSTNPLKVGMIFSGVFGIDDLPLSVGLHS